MKNGIFLDKLDGKYIELELKKRCYSLSSLSQVIFPNRPKRTLKGVLSGTTMIYPSELKLLTKYSTSYLVGKEEYEKISELESIVRSLNEEENKEFCLPLFE